MTYSFFKRFFDLCFACILFLLFFPFLIFISFLIFIDLGWPVLFIQRRTGKNLSCFKLIKFRTMRSSLPQDTSNEDRVRISQLGNFLRTFSIDELPSLVNIIAGHMSFVGPRPLLTSYTSKMNNLQLARFKVKPGLTGLVQVSGRNNLSWEQKFNLDFRYVNSISFGFDILILLKTVPALFNISAVNQSTGSTMNSFLDS